MITAKYSQISNEGFEICIKKLTTQSFPAQTAYAIKKITDDFQKWRKTIASEYRELINQFAKKDEKGEIIRPEVGNPNAFDVDDEKMAEYEAADKAFGERELTIDRPRLSIDRLGNASFSAAELAVLQPLLEEDAPVAPVVGQIGAKTAP